MDIGRHQGATGSDPAYALQSGTPDFFNWMTTKLPHIGLQPVTLLFLIVLVVMLIVVRYSKFGRYLYAIGGNEEAARLSGINISYVKTSTYMLCAALAALAGICNATRLELGDPEAGFTYELDAIAAVVIGGTSLMGGKGGMFFTFIGVLIIAYISKILSINNIDEAFRLLAKGAIIIAAVLIQQQRRKE
jgi:simple sugar transport system permease protein